jgi:hypothetical protein
VLEHEASTSLGPFAASQARLMVPEEQLAAAERIIAEQDRQFKFKKRRQLFFRVHNETFSIVAVRVSNEDRSPRRIDRCNTAPTPTGFAEIVSDDFPVL